MDSSGGAIQNAGRDYFNISSCNFTNCHAIMVGGAISNHGATGSITLCNFTNCYTDERNTTMVGVIYDDMGGLIITNCTYNDVKDLNNQNTTPQKSDTNHSQNTTTNTPTTNTQTIATNNDNTIKLTLKTIKVKKSAKKLLLQATLNQGNKALSGKKITFKFNGKAYKATTNKKGVAKVTIKKAVLKKLKVGKKVKYQASYGNVNVQNTVKVKK